MTDAIVSKQESAPPPGHVEVSLQGVSKSFGAVRALVGVSARFEIGTVSIIEGPNGSGKSTLLAILGTLARPTTGRVDHGVLGRDPRHVRASLGWVGHETLCYGDLTGRENIELAAALHGLDVVAAYAEAARRFDLSVFAHRAMRTCSRGQRQRIALARALVHKPRLLLLDEPSTGLDTASTAQLVSVVLEEVERGALVVVVTHDRELSSVLGGTHLHLERGRVTPGRP
jgi:heme exporter protein A